MKRIYVCSQLRADETHSQADHEALARSYARHVIDEGLGSPFVPHLMFPQFLDENIPAEREAGIEAGMAFLNVCDEMMVYLKNDLTISEGMKAEIKEAFALGIPVRLFIRMTQGLIVEDEGLVAIRTLEGFE